MPDKDIERRARPVKAGPGGGRVSQRNEGEACACEIEAGEKDEISCDAERFGERR